MTVTVNSKPTQVPDGESLSALIRRLGLTGQPCAAEVNRELVPRRQHDHHVLKDGDTVELVTLVGGG